MKVEERSASYPSNSDRLTKNFNDIIYKEYHLTIGGPAFNHTQFRLFISRFLIDFFTVSIRPAASNFLMGFFSSTIHFTLTLRRIWRTFFSFSGSKTRAHVQETMELSTIEIWIEIWSTYYRLYIYRIEYTYYVVPFSIRYTFYATPIF